MNEPTIHPADAQLAALGWRFDRVPSNRVLTVRNAFLQDSGIDPNGPIDEDLNERVVRWLTGSNNFPEARLVLPLKGGPRRSVHPTLAHKALWLHNQECYVCDGRLGSVRFGIRVDPFSSQTRGQGIFAQRKAAVRSQASANRMIRQRWTAEYRVCMQIVVLERRSNAKDVDNMVKGILDALQGVLYENDRCIDHLNVIKLTHGLREGFYLIRAQPTHALIDDVIDVNACTPVWNQPLINI